MIIDPVEAFARWLEQALIFVEPKGTRGYAKLYAKIANGEGALWTPKIRGHVMSPVILFFKR